MANICTTDCLYYTTSSSGKTVTINNGNYECDDDNAEPEALTVDIVWTQDGDDILFQTTFSSTIYSFVAVIRLIGGLNAQSNSAINIDVYPSYVGISADPGNFMGSDSSIAINFNIESGLVTTNGTPFPLNTYVPNDNYLIYFIDGDCGPYAATIKFTRNPPTTISSNLINQLIPRVSIPRVSMTIPRIHIEGQTKIDFSDIGDAVFTIYDEFTYYDRNKIPDNTCQSRQSDNIKTTIFRQCCPYMVSVVKGEGNTLWDKIKYLYRNNNTESPTVYIFYQNMMLYGMAKYILSRLLYGKFNINYLLGKYNERFLSKLSESRFCAFIEYFEQNDYDQYFLLKLN